MVYLKARDPRDHTDVRYGPPPYLHTYTCSRCTLLTLPPADDRYHDLHHHMTKQMVGVMVWVGVD